jgi:hypothetical protein
VSSARLMTGATLSQVDKSLVEALASNLMFIGLLPLVITGGLNGGSVSPWLGTTRT